MRPAGGRAGPLRRLHMRCGLFLEAIFQAGDDSLQLFAFLRLLVHLLFLLVVSACMVLGLKHDTRPIRYVGKRCDYEVNVYVL